MQDHCKTTDICWNIGRWRGGTDLEVRQSAIDGVGLSPHPVLSLTPKLGSTGMTSDIPFNFKFYTCMRGERDEPFSVVVFTTGNK